MSKASNLADWLDRKSCHKMQHKNYGKAAAELRQQQQRIETMEGALRPIWKRCKTEDECVRCGRPFLHALAKEADRGE